MWSKVYFDKDTHSLFVTRDRYGVKLLIKEKFITVDYTADSSSIEQDLSNLKNVKRIHTIHSNQEKRLLKSFFTGSILLRIDSCHETQTDLSGVILFSRYDKSMKYNIMEDKFKWTSFEECQNVILGK